MIKGYKNLTLWFSEVIEFIQKKFDVVVDNITFLDSKKTQESEQVSPYDIPVAKPTETFDPYSNMGEQISLDEYDDID